MPALTHGKVKNGFNLFPRTITYAQNSCYDSNYNSYHAVKTIIKTITVGNVRVFVVGILYNHFRFLIMDV